MATHQIEFSRNAVKDYKRLPGNYKTLIDLALTRLAEGGHLDIKPIKGEKNTFRIRIGTYRMLYIQMGNTYLIIRIGHRQNVYK